MKMKMNKGFSLAEIMVSLGIFSVVVYQFLGGSQFLRDFTQKSAESVALENIVQSIYDNVSSNITMYKIDYQPDEFLTKTSPEELEKTLDYGWSDKQFAKKEECKNCQGRLGYIVMPINGYRGLYRLVIRVTSPDKFKGFKDYTYLISGR